MCLACARIGANNPEDIKNLFKYSKHKTYIHTFDNKIIKLNNKQINEIIKHALVVIATGVDLSCDIWAIQWPNKYKVLTITPNNHDQ
jgi:hypothetical protein